ncbi:polysaccharide pyruvyl transferase family protein [Diplocloster agilis]|uniref:polysaccharide pyruvyl transferase family protein n=1 Tax=Diplocloster agilis TaxID=2850323 RepID=UPI0008227209|nr:polysaccharide pyruvyl transferase CsaB [uncultured Clostridium sp.]
MKCRYPNWNVYPFNCKSYAGSVLVGAGSTGFASEHNIDRYSEKLFHSILSKNLIHSARDDRSKRILENMGFQALNTGCPTTWFLTGEFCKTINKNKSDRVVFTFTDYLTDRKYDHLLIDRLRKLYEEVYFWPQGSKDYDYLMTLKNTDTIAVIPPNICAYSELLGSGNIDYIGTRLHGGLFAMQHKVRAMIIGVDNRAKDMVETHNINYIAREQIEGLEEIVNSTFETNVDIPVLAIQKWKEQFAGKESLLLC